MKIKCDCRGLVRPGAMCRHIMVGGEFCGASASKLCEHQVVVKDERLIITPFDPEDALQEEREWDRELHEAIIPPSQEDA